MIVYGIVGTKVRFPLRKARSVLAREGRAIGLKGEGGGGMRKRFPLCFYGSNLPIYVILALFPSLTGLVRRQSG